MTINIKDCYYGTPLTRYEYLRVQIKSIPEEIIRQYILRKIDHEGYVYIEVQKANTRVTTGGKNCQRQIKKPFSKFWLRTCCTDSCFMGIHDF